MAHTLIASDRVEGTPVCGPNGQKIGVIERLMIDKLSGKVAYAVLTFGGFLHFGAKHFPVPWAALSYNVVRKAYEIEITNELLGSAPFYIGDQDSIGAIGPGKVPSAKSTVPPIIGSEDHSGRGLASYTRKSRNCLGCRFCVLL
jgi:hypothetical protein